MVAQKLWKNYWSSLLPESSVCAGIPREIPTSRPYVCGNKRREFLFASLFFPSFLSLSCLFPPWHLHSRTWELNHLVKGSCQTRPQEQSLVGGMKCGQSGLHMNAHLEIVQFWALLVKLTTAPRPTCCVQSLSWTYEQVTELISDLFDSFVSSELPPPAVSWCFKRKWEERHLWDRLKVLYLWSCTTLR